MGVRDRAGQRIGAGLADTPGPNRHTREMEEGETLKPLIVAVEDSPDARLFIELSSHAADLTEASAALDRALRLEGTASVADLKRSLIGFAAVAYCRCFLRSNVRTPLGKYLTMPSALNETHEMIKAFRNQTIAHSQSELTITYPVGFLDATTMELQFVSGVTVTNTLPDSVARDFAGLISAVLHLLEDVIDPVRGRLEEVLRTADKETLLAAEPRGIDRMAEDFRSRSKRARYPTSHTLYWDREG